MRRFTAAVFSVIALGFAAQANESLFVMEEGEQTRWSSGENLNGAKGQGGQANSGAKGAAFHKIPGGESKVLMDIDGCGTIHRMWITISDREPEMLRGLRIDMYWDGAEAPAVSVPFGDFFGQVHGRMTAFENEFFASPEGRSFVSIVPMPFRSGARITVTNELDRDLDKIFYDINYTLQETQPEGAMYFHATWRRDPLTELAQDFAILPKLEGQGRFLGCHIGVIEHPDNVGWWGEGEVKVYLDGDEQWPTLVGTGTEDYIGTGWGQGTYTHRYQGCWITDRETRQHSFYRYHVPDPLWFHEDIRVTIQQMGGSSKNNVVELLEKGVEVKPVSVNYGGPAGDIFVPLLEGDAPIDLAKHDSPKGAWTNMYRRDDVCATAFFYLEQPTNDLPGLMPVAERIAGLE